MGREFDVHVFAYTDNITILSEGAATRGVAGKLKEWLHADGLEQLNMSESECFFPGPRAQEVSVSLSDGIRIPAAAEG